MKLEHKCRYCGETVITTEETAGIDWVLRMKGWYYHKECYDEWESPPSGDEEQDMKPVSAQMEDIYGIFSHCLKVKYNFHQVDRQIKNFLDKGMTLKGIYFTLYWHFVIKEQEWKPEYGIGIVPYIYDQSTQYWSEQEGKKKGIMRQIMEIEKKMQEPARVVAASPKKKKQRMIESPF